MPPHVRQEIKVIMFDPLKLLMTRDAGPKPYIVWQCEWARLLGLARALHCRSMIARALAMATTFEAKTCLNFKL